MTAQELNTLISTIATLEPLVAGGIAQIAAEKGVDPAQIIADSGQLDNVTLSNALQFRAKLLMDSTTVPVANPSA